MNKPQEQRQAAQDDASYRRGERRSLILSVALGFAVVGVLNVIPRVHTPFMVALALATTSPGLLLPTLRDAGRLDTRFGNLFVAVGTFGEVAPIVAMALLVSQQYSTWQEIGFLAVFLAVVVVAANATQ